MNFNQYPYLNLTDLNLDFIIKIIGELEIEVNNFVSVNAVKYANPIQWDITRQYEKNTIVIDAQSGTAYISVASVPSGVALTRTEFWTPVFDLSLFISKLGANFAKTYESETTLTATQDTAKDGWIVWDNTLYIALDDIIAGDAYVINSNIRRMTVEDFYNILLQKIADEANARIAEDAQIRVDLTQLIGSRVTALGEQVAQDIADEATARVNADNLLASRISANAQNIANETTVRVNADNLLASRVSVNAQDIANETTARVNADNAINARVDALVSGGWRTVYDYGYESGSDITQYVQAFINDSTSSQLYLYMNGDYTLGTLDLTNVDNSSDSIKHFVKSANTHITGDGASQISIATSENESAEIRSMYSTGADAYPHRFVHSANTVHEANGNTQINAMFIDNVLNSQDGFYHWNILGQSNIYSNTSGEDCVGYLQAHVYGDNENWALATENILHVNDETHNTRGIEIALTGEGDVSQNGGKRIGLHIVNNTTGSGFNADYGIFFSSHSNGTGFKRLIQIANGYSDYILKAESNYGCSYGLDLSSCSINSAAIKIGKSGGHCLQFDGFVVNEENQLSNDVLAIKHGNNNLAFTLNSSSSASAIVAYLDVVYNGTGYKIPLYS